MVDNHPTVRFAVTWPRVCLQFQVAVVMARCDPATPAAHAFLRRARADSELAIRRSLGESAVLDLPPLNNTSRVVVRKCFEPLLWNVLRVHAVDDYVRAAEACCSGSAASSAKDGAAELAVPHGAGIPASADTPATSRTVGDVLTGTPGVGKSSLAVLAVYVALACGRDVAFWNGQLGMGYTFCGDSAAAYDSHGDFLSEARRINRGGLIVYDTHPPPFFHQAGVRTLLVTAPEPSMWRGFVKFDNVLAGLQPPQLYVLPPWSAEEIGGMAACLPAPMPTWKEAFSCVGGVPRHVFSGQNWASTLAALSPMRAEKMLR